jgi:hypothetical protein
MPADERTTAHTEVPARRAITQRTAVRRLEAALLEHARLEDAYGRSIGTSTERSAYRRLQAAASKVTDCDRLVRRRESAG